MNKRKNFISVNEDFICGNCGEENFAADIGCRNHCSKCLWSRHVDDEVPGDRASSCGGLMRPIAIDKNGKKGFMVVHECVDCEKKILNKVASDDDFDEVINISKYD